MRDIIIIGTGNVAQVLGRLVVQKGYRIVQVLGRRPQAVQALASRWQAEAITDPALLDSRAQLAIIAISDSALEQVHRWIPSIACPVVHTAGSVPIDVLKPLHADTGVFYPLQSLRANEPDIPLIPFLVEADNAQLQAQLLELGHTLSGMASVMDGERRARMHLAAVVSSNFFNHLSALTFDYCKSAGLDPTLLMPLLEETLRRMHHAHPSDMQTGPAVRGDAATMERHLQMLSGNPLLLKLYPLLSDSIRHYHFGDLEGRPPSEA